jgi:Xaa-Pro aminopeptidase
LIGVEPAEVMVKPERAERVAAAVAEKGLDLLLVGDLVRPGDSGPDAMANLRWLTGFTGTSGLGVIGAAGERLFFTDFRYVGRAAGEVAPSFERVKVDQRLVPEVAGRLHGRVGFDEAQTSVRNLERLREATPDGVELVPAAGLVERLRRLKDEGEVEAMAEAARIADEVYEWLCERGVAGRSEAEVALAAEVRMRELGADGPSFSPIVAAGDNSALPHHESSAREIRAGELLLIDMGARVRGYCSDCTRTLAVGEVGGEEREVYEVVREAQAAGLEAVTAGIEAPAADAAARELIEAAGFGDLFGHGLGHGVGLEVHEAPRLAKRSDDVLQPGDAVTVEPGVYLPGRFGVRIEDLVIVGEDRLRNLSGFTKDLRVVD